MTLYQTKTMAKATPEGPVPKAKDPPVAVTNIYDDDPYGVIQADSQRAKFNDQAVYVCTYDTPPVTVADITDPCWANKFAFQEDPPVTPSRLAFDFKELTANR